MLTDLEINDLGIIHGVALSLAPGLNVLTGETGAGKTMVVSGLQWLLGGRADKDKVRSGARSAVVQARLAPPPPSAQDWIDDQDADLIVMREVGGRGEGGAAAGRSRARIAGQLAPVASLAEVLAPAVEIHSQHASIRLAIPAVQRSLLDRFGGDAVAKARAAYDQTHRDWRAAQAVLDTAEASLRADAREVDRLRFELEEIDEVDPQPQEEDTLDADIARMEHVEALRLGATIALDALNDDGGARETLGAAVAALREVVGHDAAIADPLDRLVAALSEVQDVAIDLITYAEDLDADPRGLDQALTRRNAIGRLLRKYGATSQAVVSFADEARRRLDIIDGGEERLDGLRRAVDDTRRELDGAGDALRVARESAGNALAAIVDGHLAELSMPDARMSVAVVQAPPTAEGADRIEFMLVANRGQPALPLGRAASGGERSRVALALRVALADADDTPVIVFDEVDAGIGGETALAVGEKLARLARGRQVICVTHLAQLAAYADVHFVVRKSTKANTTTTTVDRLQAGERAAELSRMLSGATESDAALSHAQELLDSAQQTVA